MKKEKQKEDKKIEKEKKKEGKETEKQTSDKILVYSILVLVGLVAIFLLVRQITPATERPMTIAEAHEMNILGKLEPDQGYMYGPHSFIRFNDLWYFQVQSEGILVNVPLRFGPRDVEDIMLHGGLNEKFNNASKIYISFNPIAEDLTYVALSVGELTQSLTKAFGNEVAAVCSEDCDYDACEACKGRPILNCDNKEKAIISLIRDNESSITLNGNCIDVRGSQEDLVKNVDRLLLEFYGVIKSVPEPIS